MELTRKPRIETLFVRRSLAAAALLAIAGITFAAGNAQPTTDAKPVVVRYPLDNRSVLSPDEINTIRQFELQSSDMRVAIAIPPDVKKKYADANNMAVADFNRKTPAEQAIAILTNGTDDQKKMIRISTDPSSIAEFKTVVQRQLLNGCATSSCHGSTAGGKLILHSPAINDAETYANLMILQQYSKDMKGGDGPFAAGERKLIQRGTGTQSLLANYSLPRDVAEFDHPEVPGSTYNGLYRSVDDPNYRRMINWMDKSLRPAEMDYGIKFTARPATMTSTPPATAPASGKAE